MNKMEGVKMVEIGEIAPDENQPRKYFNEQRMTMLEDSLKENGVINPLILISPKGTDGKYKIFDGERRFRSAMAIGLKSVPCNFIEGKNRLDLLVQQFHAQEQHEGWTPMEKAQVLMDLQEETKQPVEVVCERLGIPKRTAQMYLSVAQIMNKEMFTKMNISVGHAEKMNGLKKYVKRLKNESGDTFNLTEQRKLEKVLINHIKDGEIEKERDYTKLKDAFKKDIKFLDKFMEGATPEEVYVKSNSKSAYHLRQATNSANYFASHMKAYLQDTNTKPSQDDVNRIKMIKKFAQEFLDTVSS